MNKLFFIAQFLGLMLYFSCKTDNAVKLYPNNDCDTTNRSFATHVKPIFNNNCSGCHTGGGNSGSVKLDTYNDVKDAIDNKNLLKSINHQNSSSKNMPPNGKMGKCSINNIESWINQGMKNN